MLGIWPIVENSRGAYVGFAMVTGTVSAPPSAVVGRPKLTKEAQVRLRRVVDANYAFI